MKGKNWREYEPEKKQRMAEARRRRKNRKRRKGGLLKKLKLAVILFIIGYVGFMVYYTLSKPYTIALDAGHGGWDVGAEGILQDLHDRNVIPSDQIRRRHDQALSRIERTAAADPDRFSRAKLPDRVNDIPNGLIL